MSKLYHFVSEFTGWFVFIMAFGLLMATIGLATIGFVSVIMATTIREILTLLGAIAAGAACGSFFWAVVDTFRTKGKK